MNLHISKQFVVGVIKEIENNKQGVFFWAFFLYFVFAIKALIGWFANWLLYFADPVYFLAHWPIFYFCLCLSLAIILWFFTGEKIQKTTKVVFAFMPIILIVPIVDFFVYGTNVSRIYAMTIEGVIAQIFSLVGILPASVLSFGQGLTFWITEILTAIYVLAKTSNWKKAFFSVLSFFLLGAFLSSVPFLASVIFSLGKVYTYNVLMHGTFLYLVLAILLLVLWLHAYDKNLLIKLVHEARYTRCLHYLGITLIGWLYAIVVQPNTPNFLGIGFLLIACFLSFEGCLLCNNAFDLKLKGGEKKKYLDLCFVLLVFSLVSSYLAGMLVSMVVCSAIIIGLLYSLPPVRLKKIGFMNNFIIGLISMLVFIAGFLAQTQELSKIPLNASFAVLATFSLAANLKDLKDYESDKKEGVKTLPVIFGKEKGLKIVAMLTSLSFLVPPLVMGFHKIFVLAIIFGTTNYVLLLKTKNELATFVLYYVFLFIFGFALLLGEV